jgi:hypothetical protein
MAKYNPRGAISASVLLYVNCQVNCHSLPSELLAGIQTSVSAGVLRYHYDVVLFDLGSPAEGPQLAAVQNILEHCRLDASILVADTSANDVESGQSIDHLMSLLGSSCLGLIGNVATS